MEAVKNARFDTRWPAEQKEFFEYASQLGGFRTLSEFVFVAVQERAKSIVEEQNKILVSNKDREIFFNAILNPKKPNKRLRKAAEEYEKLFG